MGNLFSCGTREKIIKKDNFNHNIPKEIYKEKYKERDNDIHSFFYTSVI